MTSFIFSEVSQTRGYLCGVTCGCLSKLKLLDTYFGTSTISSNKCVIFVEGMTSEQRKENYLCDVTYVTNSELGFDYLRDNLASAILIT